MNPLATLDLPLHQEYQEATVPNGARVLAVRCRGSLATIAIGVPVGMRHEIGGRPLGITTLLARALPLGTERYRTSVAFAFALESIGGVFGQGNDQDSTQVFVSVPAEHLKEGVFAAMEMIARPRLPREATAREKRRCRGQLLASWAVPAARVSDLMDGLLWGDSPLGQRAVDLARSILHIGRDQLVAFHHQAYGPRHAACVISVPEGPERSLDLVVRAVADWGGGNVDAVAPPLRSEARVAVSRMPSDLVYLSLAALTVPRGHPDADALNLLGVVLGGSTVSRLFREIREKRGLCYDISCRSVVAATTGALLIEAGVPPEGYEDALTAIGSELRRIGNDLERAELERARTLLLSSLAMQSDRPETWAQRFCRDLLVLQRPRPFREIAGALSRVTVEDLRAVAKRYLRMDELRVAATGMAVSQTRVKRARERLLD